MLQFFALHIFSTVRVVWSFRVYFYEKTWLFRSNRNKPSRMDAIAIVGVTTGYPCVTFLR